MTERWDRLEAELSAMAPRAVPAELIKQIEQRIAAGEARPWADRCLLSAMVSGALAACVIVAVLLAQPSASTSTVNGMDEPGAPRFGDTPRLFARADTRPIDTWEPRNGSTP